MENKPKATKSKHRNQFQCYFNNTGYCKFGEVCHFQHFHEPCPKRLCRDKRCRFRHPKTCKFGEKCKFYKWKICVFRHDKSNTEVLANGVNQERELSILKEEIAKLNDEIFDLKQNVQIKENDLEVMREREEEAFKLLVEENKMLKDVISQNEKSKTKGIRVIDAQIQKLNEKEVENSNIIKELKSENEDLKTSNHTLNVRLANQQIKYLKTLQS